MKRPIRPAAIIPGRTAEAGMMRSPEKTGQTGMHGCLRKNLRKP